MGRQGTFAPDGENPRCGNRKRPVRHGRFSAPDPAKPAFRRVPRCLGWYIPRYTESRLWMNQPPASLAGELTISRVLSWTAIYLGHRLPGASSDQPGKSAGRVILPLFGLAAGGVCQASLSPSFWCALAAPFHPYRRLTAGGLFSVALSLRLPPLDVIQHPALCSSDFPPRRARRQTATRRGGRRVHSRAPISVAGRARPFKTSIRQAWRPAPPP